MEVVATDSERKALKETRRRLDLHRRAGTFGAPIADKAANYSTGFGYSRILFTHSYDGEKTFGEVGPIKQYLPDYQRLRIRSWQAMFESEIAQIVIGRFATWVIGEGLRLQSEPQKVVLKTFGIEIDVAAFSNNIEAFYSIYCESREADHARMQTKNELAYTAFVNAIVGGDVLVVLRYEDDTPTIQLVDGAHVVSPYGGNEISAKILDNGNRIENGIELSPSNEHVAYWVRKPGVALDYERIEARGKDTGLLMAFLVYGNKYRLDTHRGIPLIAVVLETIKKLERYKEATVGSAEERQKIAYFIEHALGSDGENPFTQQLAEIFGYSKDGKGANPIDDASNKLADKIQATTNKMTVNLPIASSLKQLESKNELYFKDFYGVNIDIICACVGIPPNVAMSKYDSNYSASRAAIQDWGHTLKVVRKQFINQFEKPVYSFWFHVYIFRGLIQAPGFLMGWLKKQWMVVESYLKARFVGANVPHIDPLKEVQAVRGLLGSTGLALPLTTLEAATEMLDGGGSYENMEQYANELEQSKKLGIEVPLPEPPTAAPPKKDE
jgi:capsid protein